MDAVAPRLGADVEDAVADAARAPVKDPVGARDAARERVDEDVAVVASVELQLAAHGGDADAVAVAADAGDHAAQELGRARVIGPAEAQRIEARDGPSAHREDVAQDPADAGRRALVRLDEARVVVRLHLEDRGESVADVDDARVLPGPLDDARRLWSAGGAGARRDDLYEQCSLHMTLKTPSSAYVGARPSARRARAYSSSVNLWARASSGVTDGSDEKVADMGFAG